MLSNNHRLNVKSIKCKKKKKKGTQSRTHVCHGRIVPFNSIKPNPISYKTYLNLLDADPHQIVLIDISHRITSDVFQSPASFMQKSTKMATKHHISNVKENGGKNPGSTPRHLKSSQQQLEEDEQTKMSANWRD